MARERDLQATAERSAVDGGDDGLAKRLECAQVGLDALHGGKELACVLGLGLDHRRQVTTCEEGLLRAGDDDSGDGVFCGKPY
jgi:hypothetical protein